MTVGWGIQGEAEPRQHRAESSCDKEPASAPGTAPQPRSGAGSVQQLRLPRASGPAAVGGAGRAAQADSAWWSGASGPSAADSWGPVGAVIWVRGSECLGKCQGAQGQAVPTGQDTPGPAPSPFHVPGRASRRCTELAQGSLEPRSCQPAAAGFRGSGCTPAMGTRLYSPSLGSPSPVLCLAARAGLWSPSRSCC